MRQSRFLPLLFGLMLLVPGAVLAQAAPPAGAAETIYSDAQREKDQAVSRRTVETMLASAFSIENQYAKWKNPVCARVFGLSAAEGWFVENRIRQIARAVGAPVDTADPCRANIAIFFTDDPQAVLDAIATARPFMVSGGNQKALVRYSSQAWYTSLKTDYNGLKTLDIPFDIAHPEGDCILPGSASLGADMSLPAATQTVGFCEMPFVSASDSRLHTGVTAEMATTTVLVDSKTVLGMKLGEVGDYLSFLTLAQAQQKGACQPLPTIANLMSKGCAAADTPRTLSKIDTALLTALYEVPDSPETLQKQRIIGAMRRHLEAQFGKN